MDLNEGEDKFGSFSSVEIDDRLILRDPVSEFRTYQTVHVLKVNTTDQTQNLPGVTPFVGVCLSVSQWLTQDFMYYFKLINFTCHVFLKSVLSTLCVSKVVESRFFLTTQI